MVKAAAGAVRTRATAVPDKRRCRKIGHSPRARCAGEPDEFP
jgi:hypothetical protein